MCTLLAHRCCRGDRPLSRTHRATRARCTTVGCRCSSNAQRLEHARVGTSVQSKRWAPNVGKELCTRAFDCTTTMLCGEYMPYLGEPLAADDREPAVDVKSGLGDASSSPISRHSRNLSPQDQIGNQPWRVGPRGRWRGPLRPQESSRTFVGWSDLRCRTTE